MNSLEIVFVVDRKHSPLWEAANQHFAFGHVTIVNALEFISPLALCKFISSLNPDVLIFSWRPALASMYKDFGASKKLKRLNAKILLLVPDCLGRDFAKTKKLEFWMLKKIDALLVTSEELSIFYKGEYPELNLSILHDRPNLESIRSVRDHGEFVDDLCVNFIWVGNSLWGSRQGFKDHKGLRRLVLPAFEQFQTLHSDSFIEIIDSAKAHIPNEVVLSKIQRANCLIVASDSEGTCLPLLEAAGLGTPVVTVDTGIASEFLVGDLKHLIADRTIQSLTQKMSYAVLNRSDLRQKLLKRYQQYIDSIEDEHISILQSLGSGAPKKISTGFHLFSMLWTLRWIKYKSNN